uniref:Gag protein n=1 Tax=Drosophila yakuba TaxID=7245 RepID=O44939_DROYA|nr:gag protein [Drosophila yakuba]
MAQVILSDDSSNDEVLSLFSSPESQNTPFYLEISPMSQNSNNSQFNISIINMKKSSSNSAINSLKNPSEAAIKIINSLTYKGKENRENKNAQKDPLFLTNTNKETAGAKSSVSNGPVVSLLSVTHTNRGKKLTTAHNTNAAETTNTNMDDKKSGALRNFPFPTHEDNSMERNLSSSTKIGSKSISPHSLSPTHTSKVINISTNSRSKSPALANADTLHKLANIYDNSRDHNQGETQHKFITRNTFFQNLYPKPDISKLSLKNKATILAKTTKNKCISPQLKGASLCSPVQPNLNFKVTTTHSMGNTSASRTLNRPAAKRDLFNSPPNSTNALPMSFSEVVAGTGPGIVASSDPAPITKTPGKRTNTNMDMDSFSYKTPNKKACVPTNFATPNPFPPLATPIFKSKAAKSIVEEIKAPRHPVESEKASARSVPAQTEIAPPPPKNSATELPPWQIVPQSRRAPPIHIKNVREIVPLLEKLNYSAGVDSFTTKTSIGNGVTIQAKDLTAHRIIKDILAKSGIPYYSNQNKSERGFRVVIRHLHPSTPCSWITSELQKLGHQTKFTRNMTNPATGGPMRMHEIEIVSAMDGSHLRILSIKQLGGQKVEIERKNRTRELVQCFRCQGFRHARNTCMKPPRCMKCAGQHWSSECTKPRSTPATCSNCQGNHISAYKGCPAYKAEKQKLAVNRIDFHKIRTIMDAKSNNNERQPRPPFNKTPRLPYSTEMAEARKEAARKSAMNPFRQNVKDSRPNLPYLSSHEIAIQKRLNKWRRSTNKASTNSRTNPKVKAPNMTKNPAQRHLEKFQNGLRKEQKNVEKAMEHKQGKDDSPPTTSRAALANLKPKIVKETTPSPQNINTFPENSQPDDPVIKLANRVDNLEKKIDILMALIIQARNAHE